MRISDWSSDVCSSDLRPALVAARSAVRCMLLVCRNGSEYCMHGVIMFPHQTNRRVVTKSTVLQFSGIQGPTGMSGSDLVIPASVMNEGTGTLRKVNTCR